MDLLCPLSRKQNDNQADRQVILLCIDKGFRLIAPDLLFEDDTLPEVITGFMDKAVYARGFYDAYEIVEPVDDNKRPPLIRNNA